MLKQAMGLHRDTLHPWYLEAHYKAYDAAGKLKVEGDYEYVWLAKNRWHATYSEGATVWTKWHSDAGVSSPPAQPETLPYPQSMISELVRNPMEALDAPKEAPPLFREVDFGKVKLTCFSAPPPYPVSVPHGRWCVAPGRPILQLADPGYFAFFTQIVAFQHQFAAKQIVLHDDDTPVLDIHVEQLRSPTPQEAALVSAPASALLVPQRAVPIPGSVTAGSRVKKVEPVYPEYAKSQRIQGTVRLAGLIQTDGTVSQLEVLHSPNPALTDAAEEAVRQWRYQPYLLDGKPVTVSTQIRVTFTLGN